VGDVQTENNENIRYIYEKIIRLNQQGFKSMGKIINLRLNFKVGWKK